MNMREKAREWADEALRERGYDRASAVSDVALRLREYAGRRGPDFTSLAVQAVDDSLLSGAFAKEEDVLTAAAWRYVRGHYGAEAADAAKKLIRNDGAPEKEACKALADALRDVTCKDALSESSKIGLDRSFTQMLAEAAGRADFEKIASGYIRHAQKGRLGCEREIKGDIKRPCIQLTGQRTSQNCLERWEPPIKETKEFF